MNKNLRLFLVLLSIICFTSCSSYKKTTYFRDLDRFKYAQQNIENYSVSTIQPSDILSINVSSLNPEASSPFNPTTAAAGYKVDQKGEIKFPVIGSVKASGFTTQEFADDLGKKLQKYLQEPSVNVSISNFKVFVMGDVAKPGIVTTLNERLTVTEALTESGDLNITAKRNDLMLIREQNGKREFIPIDLTSKKLFESPYYYLKNNDVLYIQPGRSKFAALDRSFTYIGLILSLVSIGSILITR